MRLVERVVSLGIPFLAGLASFAWGAASAMGRAARPRAASPARLGGPVVPCCFQVPVVKNGVLSWECDAGQLTSRKIGPLRPVGSPPEVRCDCS